MASQNGRQLFTVRNATIQDPSPPPTPTSSSAISRVTYLLLEGGGDQAPQLGETAVDAVSSPLLYDLRDDDRSLHVGTSQSVLHASMDGHSYFPSQNFCEGDTSILTLWRGKLRLREGQWLV